MDFYQAQEFFKKLFPGKSIEFSFDEKCHRTHEIIYTDALPNVVHHIENLQVKVSVEGMEPQYVPIAPHREVCSWAHIKKLILSKKDVHIVPSQIEQLKAMDEPERSAAIRELALMTDLSEAQIVAKLQ
jgi:hypothetical protein